ILDLYQHPCPWVRPCPLSLIPDAAVRDGLGLVPSAARLVAGPLSTPGRDLVLAIVFQRLGAARMVSRLAFNWFSLALSGQRSCGVPPGWLGPGGRGFYLELRGRLQWSGLAGSHPRPQPNSLCRPADCCTVMGCRGWTADPPLVNAGQ